MQSDIWLLVISAMSIGFIHTLMGPDHYLPFIMLSRARNWSFARTMAITVACGVGHVLSSIFIGFIGIAAGIAISRIEGLEGMRGDIASYILFAFGLAYMAWGIKRGIQGKTVHNHPHVHEDGTMHSHQHSHGNGNGSENGLPKQGKNTTFWWLFIIFVLGPCEPLIPVLMYPAAKVGTGGVILVAAVFSLVTVLTMSVMVALAYFGLKQVRFAFFERFAHALGGFVIALSGAAIIFLGL
jgi:ABC-type nickel/cobalt efflux system permease component RcnA